MVAFISGTVIFLNLLDIAFSVRPGDLARVLRDRGLVFRALLSVLLLVPLFVWALSFVTAIPPHARVCLALLACSPGAPLGAKRAAQLGSPMATALGLQLVLALVGVLAAPATLFLMAESHGLEEWIPIRDVLWQIATVQAVPLALGLALNHRWPAQVGRFTRKLSLVANLSMLLLALLSLVVVVKTVATLTLSTWLAVLAMCAFSLTVGHLLGGPAPETRVAVAVASANRNLGLAIFLGTFVKTEAGDLVMIFALVNFFAGAAYKAFVRRMAP